MKSIFFVPVFILLLSLSSSSQNIGAASHTLYTIATKFPAEKMSRDEIQKHPVFILPLI
jgi:hypothetical protein